MRILPITILLALTHLLYAQQPSPLWTRWNWLLGDWKGEASGEPGEGGGFFSLKIELDGSILLRKSHSQYPTTVHDDLMIIYPGKDSLHARALYVDNEKHVINYSVTIAESVITFLSDPIPGAGYFQLRYVHLGAGLIDVIFEMSRDGERFTPYVQGRCRKAGE